MAKLNFYDTDAVKAHVHMTPENAKQYGVQDGQTVQLRLQTDRPITLGGDAIRYGIEGRSYALEPGDMILVPQGCVHRPEAPLGAAYDRMLLYLSPEYLRSISTEETALETCFLQAAEEFHFVIRTGRRNGTLLEPLFALERTLAKPGFGQTMLEQALVAQVLISLTRGMQEQALPFASASAADEKIAAILQYLACHLTEPVSIDAVDRLVRL